MSRANVSSIRCPTGGIFLLPRRIIWCNRLWGACTGKRRQSIEVLCMNFLKERLATTYSKPSALPPEEMPNDRTFYFTA